VRPAGERDVGSPAGCNPRCGASRMHTAGGHLPNQPRGRAVCCYRPSLPRARTDATTASVRVQSLTGRSRLHITSGGISPIPVTRDLGAPVSMKPRTHPIPPLLVPLGSPRGLAAPNSVGFAQVRLRNFKHVARKTCGLVRPNSTCPQRAYTASVFCREADRYPSQTVQKM